MWVGSMRSPMRTSAHEESDTIAENNPLTRQVRHEEGRHEREPSRPDDETAAETESWATSSWEMTWAQRRVGQQERDDVFATW